VQRHRFPPGNAAPQVRRPTGLLDGRRPPRPRDPGENTDRSELPCAGGPDRRRGRRVGRGAAVAGLVRPAPGNLARPGRGGAGPPRAGCSPGPASLTADGKRALVTVIARESNTGFVYFMPDDRVLKNGGPPILLEPTVRQALHLFGSGAGGTAHGRVRG